MDAEDWRQLHSKIDAFLITAGPLLRTQPQLFREASEIFASIYCGHLAPLSAKTVELYVSKVEARFGKVPPTPWPAHAVGRFPFNRPKPPMQEQLHEIEGLLAPLSDKRGKAAAASRDLPPRLRGPSLLDPED
jgi:hypothetical protein